ncbi:hypothetical protein EDD21DRAFT_367593 [Dissophora ornata]|nr:hypothetical protein BGZ58_007393 [Dissophora ornata]KAI8604003.1 hypothetical protein EDD21DRAFT_367593 [Dissophora ornata]
MNTTFPQTEINIEALENVKTRLFQLQESILYFLRSINPETTPGTVQWTDIHSKFNVLIAKYLHLTNLVNDPHSTLLQSYTVFPHEPPANDQHVQNLSVLLRTKLFPELEQESEDRIKEGSVPGLTNGGGSTAEERKVLQAFKLKVMMHDALCQSADEIFENQRDMVHTKVRYESDVEGEDADDDEDDEDFEEATPGASSGAIGDKAILPTNPQSGNSNKRKEEAIEIPPVVDFAIGAMDNSSVRYMNDWSGTLSDAEGYNSGFDEGVDGADEEEFDDSYFERRRQEGSNDNEDEESEEDEDAFMEVSTESLAIGADSGSSTVHMAEDMFHGDADSGEEDMEEVM